MKILTAKRLSVCLDLQPEKGDWDYPEDYFLIAWEFKNGLIVLSQFGSNPDLFFSSQKKITYRYPIFSIRNTKITRNVKAIDLLILYQFYLKRYVCLKAKDNTCSKLVKELVG